jgi:rod shape-determining protein MreC
LARKRIARRTGFRLTSGVAAATALVIAAGVLLVAPALHKGADQVQSADDDAIAAGGRVGGGVFDFVGDTIDHVKVMWNAGDRIKALEKQNAELHEWKELALTLAERQQRYEALLNIPPEQLGQQRRDEQTVSARLILDIGGPFKRTLLANAGFDHGVKVGYVAINENGLIGRVLSAGRRSSRVLLLDDYNSRVPVMGEVSRARAIMVGQAAQNARLDEGPFRMTDPRLDYVVGQSGFLRGERLVTSGDGGIYPRGLLVGQAVQEGAGWTVKLGAARAPIDYIRLIPFYAPDSPPDALSSEQALPRPPQSLYTGAAMVAAPPPPPPTKPKQAAPILPPTADEEVTPPGPN